MPPLGPKLFFAADWPPTREYRRENGKALFDPLRSRLVIATPEEYVRQAFIRYLVEEIGVPEGMLHSEVPLSRWDAKRRGRADIVGQDAAGEFFLVVECKAEILEDKAFAQLVRYNEVFGASITAVCNADETWWYQNGELLDGPPTYAEMRSHSELPRFEDLAPIPRPAFGDLQSPKVTRRS